MTGIREEEIAAVVDRQLRNLSFNADEMAYLTQAITRLKANWVEEKERQLAILNARLQQVTERLNRLTDAYLDHAIENLLYEDRKTALLFEKKAIESQLADLKAGRRSIPGELQKFVELAGEAYSLYQIALHEKKRRLLRLVTSNFTASPESLDFAYAIPFHEVANRERDEDGRASKGVRRTLDDLLASLATKIEAMPEMSFMLDDDPAD